MNVDLGIPTLIECSSMEQAAELAHALHFQFVELNMNLPYCTLENLQKADLKGLMDAYQVYFTVHADENLFFCDLSERVARAHLDNMLDTIAICLEHGLPLINFHMSKGIYFTLPKEKVYLFDKYPDVYYHRLDTFREKCEKAAKGKVMLCIENTGLDLSFVHDGVDRLLSSPAFSLTWDIGHDYSAGNADRDFLLQRNQRIRHMHFHDAIGKACHLPLGSGDMKLTEYLENAKPERMVVEVKTVEGLHQSLPWLHQNGWMKK